MVRKVVFKKQFIQGLRDAGFTEEEINDLIKKHNAEIS